MKRQVEIDIRSADDGDVYLDGNKLPGVFAVSVVMQAGSLPEVTISFAARDLKLKTYSAVVSEE